MHTIAKYTINEAKPANYNHDSSCFSTFVCFYDSKLVQLNADQNFRYTLYIYHQKSSCSCCVNMYGGNNSEVIKSVQNQ